MCKNLKPSIGFTLIELVMVIVILGILSATALPKFFDSSIFKSRGFADQVLATLRYAQKSAIAQRRLVCADLVATAPASITLTIANLSTDSSCTLSLNLPGVQANILTAPTGISLTTTATTFTFDAIGRTGTTISISIPDVTTAITVEAETGYVHQ